MAQAPRPGHALGDLLGRRRVQLAREAAVGHEHDAVGDGGRARVVGDHHERAPAGVDGVAQQRQHLAPGAQVERAGRLVGEQDLGLADQRAGDRHALLLAARELRRAMAGAIGQPDRGQRAAAPASAAAVAPASRDGSATFCAAVSAPSRLKD